MKKKRLVAFILALCLVFIFAAQSTFAASKFTSTYGAQVWFMNGNVNFELQTYDGQNHTLRMDVVLINNGIIVGESSFTQGNTTLYSLGRSSTDVDNALVKFYIDGNQVAYLSEFK